MKPVFQLTVFGAGLATLAYLAAPARADEWNKQTTVQFNEPVELPGHVLLPGTYTFRLADLSNRNVLQVFRQDKKGIDHLVTTEFVVPIYQLNTPSNLEVKVEERHNNTPEALHTLFYPGDNYGWQFVYPHKQQEQIQHGNPALTARTGS